MQQIIHYLTIGASPERVFWALTTIDGLSAWWTERVSIEQPFGGHLNFEFLPDFNPSMELVNIEQTSRVEWKCVGGHAAWRGHGLSFELRASESDANLTQLLFRQTCTYDLDDERYGMYNTNWAHYLTSLKGLCETGIGQPYRQAA